VTTLLASEGASGPASDAPSGAASDAASCDEPPSTGQVVPPHPPATQNVPPEQSWQSTGIAAGHPLLESTFDPASLGQAIAGQVALQK
jgi:hypothetical protein